MNEIKTSETALLALDLQTDFLADDGRLPVARTQVVDLLKATNRLLIHANGKRWPVVYVVNEFSPWDYPANLFRRHAAIREQPGVELDRRIVKVRSQRFTKSKSDAFSNPDLAAFLEQQGVEEVILSGVFAEGCVWRTALGALRAGFTPVVVADAVASATDARRTAAFEKMVRRGITVVTLRDMIR